MQWEIRAFLDPTGANTQLTNVQNVTVNTGRQALMDNFRATTASIVCRYPNGYASPISGLIPGATIQLSMRELTTNLYFFYLFTGKITDVEVQYGIPYASNVGNDDYLVISLEGALGELARSNGNDYALARDFVDQQVTDASTESGVSMIALPVAYFNSRYASATTISGSWADWLNNMAFTFAGRITDNDGQVALFNYQPVEVISDPTFSDVTGATKIQYDQINFDSLAQNYYTQVTVVPPSGVEQIASTGSAPYRNLQLNGNLSDTNGQALDVANWYLGNYDSPALALASLHVNMNDPNALQMESILDSNLPFGSTCLGVGRQVSVTFRGTTYTVIIEGAALSATPGECGVTLYVSGADLNAYLVLDDAVFGKLDSNKLGF